MVSELAVPMLKRWQVDKETIREIAVHLRLPARLSASGKSLGIAAGVIGVAGALPVLGPAAAIVGARFR